MLSLVDDEQYRPPERSWIEKFRDAFRGIKLGVRGQGSFFVHLFFAAAVILAAAVLKVTYVEWCLLILCITVVLGAEMFNSALEWFARAVAERRQDADLGGALDIGSAAVLVASAGAAIVGAIIFGRYLGTMLGWW